MLETLLHDNHFSKIEEKPCSQFFPLFSNLNPLLIVKIHAWKKIKRDFQCRIHLSHVLRAIRKVHTSNRTKEKG